MSTKTGLGLALYAKAQLGRPYWWGTFGQTASAQLLAAKRAQYPSYYTAIDFPAQYGYRVHDCVGLIKGYLWSDTPESPPVYGRTPDVAVSGLYDACKRRGEIGSIPEIPGVCVFKKDMGHVGVYVGKGMVIEALGHAYGVVTSALGSRPWAYWGMPKWIDYGSGAEPAADIDAGNETPTGALCTVELPLLKRGATGEAVRAAQALLLLRGYELPRWGTDGDFGDETAAAVEACQADHDLTVDTEIGPDTWAVLIEER